MNIISLRASNVKKLVAVAIDPTGALVRITGANGAGKSSVLDAIWYALGGQSAMPSNPVREGEEKAEITLTLGVDGVMKYRVTRKLTKGKTNQVIVENADGARFPSPQAFLDRLVGALTFDPEAFSRMSPKARLQQLRDMVKLDVDVDALDDANKADFERRTEINRQVKSLRERVETYAAGIESDMDVEPIHVEALLNEVEEASRRNDHIAAAARERKKWDDNAADYEAMAKDQREKAAELLQKAERYEQTAAEYRALIANADPLPAPVEVSDITRQIQDATRENTKRDLQRQQRERHELAKREWEAAFRISEDLTLTMEKRTEEKRAAIARAKMPVDGLSFGDNGVLLHGQPWEQAATGEQIDAAVEMAMAFNPEVKIIFIRNGSLLDATHRARVAARAEEKGYQVFSEEVDETGAVGIYFEDGEVTAINGVPVSKDNG
jgi:DNA repair exonuclease SbcCD ATPase subunit